MTSLTRLQHLRKVEIIYDDVIDLEEFSNLQPGLASLIIGDFEALGTGNQSENALLAVIANYP